MGLYLEPQMNKGLWLQQNGRFIVGGIGHSDIDYNTIAEDDILVCNVDNGFFYAAAVAFSEKEFNEFDKPDGRNKQWFVVDKEKAKSVAPDWKHYFI